MDLRSQDISATFWDCLVTGPTFNSDSRGHPWESHFYRTFQTQNGPGMTRVWYWDLGSFLAFSAVVNRWIFDFQMKLHRMIWFSWHRKSSRHCKTLIFSCMLFLRCKAHRRCKSLLDLDKYWHRQPSLRLEWELHLPNGCTAAATKIAWLWSTMAGPWAVCWSSLFQTSQICIRWSLNLIFGYTLAVPAFGVNIAHVISIPVRLRIRPSHWRGSLVRRLLGSICARSSHMQTDEVVCIQTVDKSWWIFPEECKK